jgi:hypothetical protein
MATQYSYVCPSMGDQLLVLRKTAVPSSSGSENPIRLLDLIMKALQYFEMSDALFKSLNKRTHKGRKSGVFLS